MGIRQIPAKAGRPQTNGNAERLRGTIRRALASFKEESAAAIRGTNPGDHV